jgi:quercetin dioxygenase-like cupin family protein
MAERPETAVEIVLPAGDIDETITFFRDRLGFRLETIFPADAPRVAVLRGQGATVRLDRDAGSGAGHLRVPTDGAPTRLIAPNGTIVELFDPTEAQPIPALAPSLVVHTVGPDDAWSVGRAGMLYRDLVPDRQGGRFIVSHIRIPTGGPVPDYVHFHEVRFQMIYCRAGWVRVVYEDQGEPFVMHPGDCVLQPPRIRHRVLESSDGLEVVEVGCPAEHPTRVDHDMELPNATLAPERLFDGQRFIRHVADGAGWTADRDGFESRDLGFTEATGGVADARVLRPVAPLSEGFVEHDAEFAFTFVLTGEIGLDVGGADRRRLRRDDAVVLPAGLAHRLVDPSPDLELLSVMLPADYRLRVAR